MKFKKHMTKYINWAPALATALILLVPLFGNLYVSGWNWSGFDFALMGALIFATLTAAKEIWVRGRNNAFKLASFMALGGAFLLFWVTGAVGIIGEDNPGNLLYLVVIAVLVVGAFLTRVRPKRMVGVMFAAATVQFLVPVAAYILWPADFGPGVVRVFLLSGAFAAMFAASGLLFKRS